MRARSIPCRVNADTRVGVAHIRALAAEGGCVQTSLEAKPGNAALWKRQRRHEVLAKSRQEKRPSNWIRRARPGTNCGAGNDCDGCLIRVIADKTGKQHPGDIRCK